MKRFEVAVQCATDGTLHHVMLPHDATVSTLRSELALRTRIPPDDQILLYGPPYARLDPKKPLASYGFPSAEKKTFLYSRALLSPDSSPPPIPPLVPLDLDIPTVPNVISQASRALAESSSPLLRALAEYEQQFALSVAKGQVYRSGAESRIQACATTIQQMKIQEDAIAAAFDNLGTFRSSISKSFQAFEQHCQEQQEQHQSLLDSFESDLQALGAINLHKSLETSDRKTLLDCIPVEREQQWAQECRQSHLILGQKTEELRGLYKSVAEVAASSKGEAASRIGKLEGELAALQGMAQKQTESLNILSKNYEIVMSRVNELIGQRTDSASVFGTSSTSALEAVRGLEELLSQQSEVLHTMEEADNSLRSFMLRCTESRTKASKEVISRLQQVASVQSKIRELGVGMNILKEALARQHAQFLELEHIRRLPDAYRASLREVARRKLYGRIFTAKLETIAEELGQMREQEMALRESFLREHGQHLPRDLVPGLVEKPTQCEIRTRPFDISLPDVEMLAEGGEHGGEQREKVEEEMKGSLIMPSNPDWGAPNDSPQVQEKLRRLEYEVSRLQGELEREKSKNVPLKEKSTSSPPPSPKDHEELRNMKVELENSRMLLVKYEAQQHDAMLNAAAIEANLHAQIQKQKQLDQEVTTLRGQLDKWRAISRLQSSALRQIKQGVCSMVEGDDRHDTEEETELVEEESCNAIVAKVTSGFESLRVREERLKAELTSKSEELGRTLESSSMQINKISFRSFEVNDLALFLPTSAPSSSNDLRIYLAFHLGCPHRYLSDESIASFRRMEQRYPDYILGKIVYVDEEVATETNNPYSLHLGTVFYVLTVASLTDI